MFLIAVTSRGLPVDLFEFISLHSDAPSALIKNRSQIIIFYVKGRLIMIHHPKLGPRPISYNRGRRVHLHGGHPLSLDLHSFLLIYRNVAIISCLVVRAVVWIDEA